jgi:predicted HTH domain antitoxin
VTIHLEIDHDTQQALEEAFGQGLSRAAIEALSIEGYRTGKLSAYQVQKLLGFEDRWQTQDWLATRGIPLNYTSEDLEADRQTLDRTPQSGSG